VADLEDVIARLETAADDLADLAIRALRSAIDRGDTGRPADERAITRARSGVVRAIGILRGAPQPAGDDD
jgi:hypothetical protein